MRQFQERLAQMTPEEREQFEARRAARGGGGGGFGGRAGSASGARRASNASSGPNVPAVERGATTIDALFGALPEIETTGQVWVMEGGRLEQVSVRLGVTDGTATELLGVRPRAPGAPVSQPARNPQLDMLREQLATVEDDTERSTLARTIEQLEQTGTPQSTPRPATEPRLAAGTALVTNVTTPDSGQAQPSSAGGSPLIPQFGRRR